MKKNSQIIIIILLGMFAILALVYGKNIFLDKTNKVSNIQSLQHSGASDIE